MAEDSGSNIQQQYGQVYTLAVQPGIKRDGTIFESRDYSDGEWCRFQRGTPKKMGGYSQMFSSVDGIARGMIMNSYNGVNYVFTGTNQGIDVFTTGTSLGQGSGPYAATIIPGYSEFAINTVTTYTFTITSSPAADLTALFPVGTKLIFSQTTPVEYVVSGATYSAPDTTVTVTTAIAGTPTSVWFYNTSFSPDNRLLWQWDMQYSSVGAALKVLAHPGLNLVNIDNSVESQVLIGDLLPVTNQNWEFSGLADTGGQNPTYRPITADGGVCVLYPYVFVYGSYGFIANNHVSSTYGSQELTDWNGATANQINMAAGKIVRGSPVRGGTNSPSGLFWATDSLIRVSFTGQASLYWRYDIISSQTSIMSSSAVVEADGISYWMGVDRFYLYNGSVSVLPNDKNVNWLFDNLNFPQRQKVWATKVPRYNEIWFFYPRGTSTECNDAIIYNVKDKIWYDAGSAVGAQRSCGYTTEVFPSPVWANWNYDIYFSNAYTTIAPPAVTPPAIPLPAPNPNQFYLYGDVTPQFSPGDKLSFTNNVNAVIYTIATSENIFNVDIGTPGVTLVTCTENFDPVIVYGDVVYRVEGGYGIYQHEIGLNSVSFFGTTAITSSFTTCDISWVGGNPSADSAVGVNRRMHLRRVEPDFVQGQDLELNILGAKFARGGTQVSGPYYFDKETGKVDLRVENRETRLQFVSNTIGGNYELGRILITAEYGDERP